MTRRSDARSLGILSVGLVVRFALLPLGHGQDFRVWDLASAATLRGINVYAHHPRYPGGPYAYFPLFLWVEVPLQWLAQHGLGSFVVLGKLPMVAADCALGWLVRTQLRRHGAGAARADLALAVLLLNPLVLYNSAFYGRFDSVALALLFAATLAAGPAGRVPWRSAWLFALAVAAKTFPVTALPGFLRRGPSSAWRVAVALVTTLLVLLLPYLGSLPAVYHDLFLYDAGKSAQALSWQQVAAGHWPKLVMLVVGATVLVAAARSRLGRDLPSFTLLALLLFLLVDQVVLEQYLTWPLAYLLLQALAAANCAMRVASWLLFGLLTVVGMLVNASVHPFGPAPVWLATLLAVAVAGYCALLACAPSGVAAALPSADDVRQCRQVEDVVAEQARRR